jgi:hypothetical protein
MALYTFECDRDVRLRCPLQVALRGCVVKILDCPHERRALLGVLRGLQHHPPGIVCELLQFSTVRLQTDPITRHHTLENPLSAVQFLAHDAIQLRALARACGETTESRECDRERDNDVPSLIHLNPQRLCHDLPWIERTKRARALTSASVVAAYDDASVRTRFASSAGQPMQVVNEAQNIYLNSDKSVAPDNPDNPHVKLISHCHA